MLLRMLLGILLCTPLRSTAAHAAAASRQCLPPSLHGKEVPTSPGNYAFGTYSRNYAFGTLTYTHPARACLGAPARPCFHNIQKTTATFTGGGESFSASGSVALRPGFTAIMGWKAVEGYPLPPLTVGEALELKDCVLHQVCVLGGEGGRVVVLRCAECVCLWMPRVSCRPLF